MSNFEAFRETMSAKGSAEGVRDSFVEGEYHSVNASGLFFTVSSWDDGKHVFGPAPWRGGVAPTAGSRVLVVFVGVGVGSPWVLGLWP